MKSNKTWNQHVVKKENKALVLRIINERSPISRAAIAQVTGLNKGTVSSLVNELLAEQLVYESGPGTSSGGRRPVMLLFNQAAGYAIGIDLGVNYLLGILTDLQGNICLEMKIRLEDTAYPEIEHTLIKVIDYLTASAPPSPYGVIGIGVGVPGTVNQEGSILSAPNLGWKNRDIKKTLEKKYAVPVTIENEANAGARGEKKFGAEQDLTDIVYVSAGIGIGVGLILNNELYKGVNGLSGEMGHMIIQADGKQCRCGNKGCWELYASEKALLEGIADKGIALDTTGGSTLEKLIQLAEMGDNETIRLFENIGDYLGIGINNIINIFNPEKVVIGNQLAFAEKWLRKPLEQRLAEPALGFEHKNLHVMFSKLSTHATALGAAAITVEAFLEAGVAQEGTP